MKNTFFILLLSMAAVSCISTNPVQPVDSCSVIITHQLKNPYTEPIPGNRAANPSHEYVKFHIYNSRQVKELEAKGAVLLDHPFDAAPDRNNNYKTEHTSQYATLYGVVPAGVNYSAYSSEKISDLYMRNNGASRNSNARATIYNGQVSFFDPIDSAMVPLKGVKVILKDVTNTISGITDSLGKFTITSSLLISDTVEILLKFDNDYVEIHTLNLSNLLGVVNTSTFSLGFKKSCAFSNINIQVGNQFKNSELHHACAALLSMNKYTEFARHYGYSMPDKKMLFWLGMDALISSHFATPMLQNMAVQNIANPEQLLTNLFGIPVSQAAILAPVIKDELPDLYAPFYTQYLTIAKASFVETMFHELSHASHYAKVGPAYWLPYVEYIYSNVGYGDSSANSGRISLSEAWAEDLSNIGLNYIYGKQKYLGYNENNTQNWIPYGLYYDLYDSGSNESFDNVSGITFPEIYNLFDVNTNTLAALKIKLKNNYPAQQAAIDVLFQYYGY
jgi:hypothetical protein